MIAKDKVMMVMIIFIWLFRLFALKLDFENGRDTGTGTGLFCKRTSRVMDTEIWFENYQDTVADEMPDSAFYRLLSCQTKKTVYLTYVEKPKKLGSISPLPSPFFENVEEELQDSNYFKSNQRTFPKLLKYDFLFRHKLFVLSFQTSRFSKCGVCVLLREHLQNTWSDRKRLRIEQQW